MQTFDLSFTGLDTDCASGAGSAAADPWTSVAYTSADGTLTTTLSVDTGGAASDVKGRAFVVHGYDGGRISCALLTEGPVLSASGGRQGPRLCRSRLRWRPHQLRAAHRGASPLRQRRTSRAAPLSFTATMAAASAARCSPRGQS